MLYAVFDNFHSLVNPIRQDILRGGAKNRCFCVFLTLEFEFLTIYEVSRPLRRRKPFNGLFYIFPRFQATISTSTGSSNLLTITSTQCFFAANIKLLHTKTRSYVVCSHQNSIVCSLFIAKHLCGTHYSVINVARMFPCVEIACDPIIF